MRMSLLQRLRQVESEHANERAPADSQFHGGLLLRPSEDGARRSASLLNRWGRLSRKE
jgi:hypothetical protein